MSSNGLLILAEKLKRLRNKLRSWNKSVFGRVDVFIRELEERIETLEDVIQSNFSMEVDDEFLVTKAKLEVWNLREDTRLA